MAATRTQGPPRTRSGRADALFRRYRETRRLTEQFCEPLCAEDCVVQSMPDVSPTRWHLAHTTWFFERFVLSAFQPGYVTYDAAYEHLFNSYYNTVGTPFPRPQRGLLSRPTVAEVFEYRRAVDGRMERLFHQAANRRENRLLDVVEIGVHHEQQHQELMLTDIKHIFSCNPLLPAYHGTEPVAPAKAVPLIWHAVPEGVYEIGHRGRGFAYDNEGPRHRVFLEPFRIANRLVTNGEFRQFVEDDGYGRPELWLSLGWNRVQELDISAPFYWVRRGSRWHEYTLHGLEPLCDARPVCHVNYFEADAYARWAGHRLPTEFEWEIVAGEQPIAGNFVEQARLHPVAAESATGSGIMQLYGDTWEWTSSSYAPYPRYRPPAGAIGEYNGKFMCNQYVLRGGSCATSQTHVRPTYRNFFPPEAQWQFTGIRLAN